jgi:membrane protein implicated in regulation of membrane protease activity
MGNEVNVLFVDTWLWLIFVGIGLVLVLMELFLGVDTGLDLVFIGSALILGGLITLALESWVWTAVAAGVIAAGYIAIGRRYLHRHIAVDAVKTNIDTIIGKSGTVLEPVTPGQDGIVRVGNEDWRARSESSLEKGDSVTVAGLSGVTLTVEKKPSADGGTP